MADKDLNLHPLASCFDVSQLTSDDGVSYVFISDHRIPKRYGLTEMHGRIGAAHVLRGGEAADPDPAKRTLAGRAAPFGFGHCPGRRLLYR
jgi:hypothetical protein